MQNFVQQYVAPTTIGVDQATLQKYEGKYQFTDVPNDKVTVMYKGTPTAMNWQERGQFGTIKPYFGPLVDYVQGLAPPVIGSDVYNWNLAQAERYGNNQSTKCDTYNYNTPFFWLHDWSHLPPTYVGVARAKLPANLSILESARFFAALGLGVFESCNANYGMKWGHLINTNSLWRPITAIRSGDTFGNAAVSDWTPQLVTPMHPEFPSGHCAHIGAAMQVLRLVLGEPMDVVVRTDYSDPGHNPQFPKIPNRRFANLSTIELDVKAARIYGGIHYSASCDAALTLARKAGESSYSYFYNKPDPIHKKS